MSRAFATFFLLTLASLTILACGGGSSQSNGGSGNASGPEPTRAPTPFSVSATALQSEKERNEVAWEGKFVDKFVLITGSISSITEAGNKYDVKLETANFTVDVVCKVDKAEESTVLSLQRGQTVSVLGRVTDDGILDIVVEDCSVATSDESPPSAGRSSTPAAFTLIATPAPTYIPAATPVATLGLAAAATAPTLSPTAFPTATPVATPAPPAATSVPPTAAPMATATPAPAVSPTSTSTAITLGMTLDNPMAPGEVLQGTDGVEIVVTGILEDATDLVMATNQFNDPPEEGNRFYLVTVAVSYVSGSDSLNVSSADYRLIGNNRFVYSPFENSCGVVPDELNAELFPGGQAEGNVCFQIQSDDDDFLLVHEPFLSYGGERRFLALE